MRDVESIHHAARGYCLDRIAAWQCAYSKLTADRLDGYTDDAGGWDYSDAAHDTFPRYLVLQAILEEVEQFTPDDFASVEEARGLLAAAAEMAQSAFTETGDATSIRAMQDERRRFIAWLGALSPQQLDTTQPLPFRRVLGRVEAGKRFGEVEARWGRWYGGSVDREPQHLPPHLVLQASVLEEQGRLDVIPRLLAERGVERVFELREWGASYERELASAVPSYNGAEGWLIVPGAEWLVQASHEDSLTVGGDWLVEALRRQWPDWRDLIYRGWDQTGPPVM